MVTVFAISPMGWWRWRLRAPSPTGWRGSIAGWRQWSRPMCRMTLKLGQARGVVLLVPALASIPVFEYSANLIKKSLVGTGHATKDQVTMMIRTLLPGARLEKADAADALAAAVCHAHHRTAPARRLGLTVPPAAVKLAAKVTE